MNIFNNEPPVKCKHCNRIRGQHKANTLHCPLGRARKFPQFSVTYKFEAKEPKCPRPRGEDE